MNKIVSVISKHPIYVILFMVFTLLILIIGITSISLSTGNSTMVKEDTKTYRDNLAYENEFGGETIILHLEPNGDLLTLNVIELFNDLEEDLSSLEGVFSYQSPATLVKNMTQNQYVQFQEGIKEIGLGLGELGLLLTQQADLVNQLDPVVLETASSELQNALGLLSTGQGQLSDSLVRLESGFTSLNDILLLLQNALENEGDIQKANQLSQVITEMNTLIAGLENIQDLPLQSIHALDAMAFQLDQLFTQLLNDLDEIQGFIGQLNVLSANLQTMSETLLMIESYSDSFYAGIPRTEDTLENLLYDNKVRRSIFDVFIIEEKYVMMQVTLEGQVSKEEKQSIVDAIELRIEDNDFSGQYLLSGKSVLDLSIQNSMMSSMQKMLMLSVSVMILIMLITFKVRWRILPLVTVMIAVIMTVGTMGYLSIPITMVSMAVFPILIGLGIDYAIQFQNRYHLAMEEDNE
ncbi:MMPL family transporter [Hujiaoplasma nucleasis]|uniref:MMPL family transporter n=1 Tax=Hujiaoplasma nucleasis TaxID=2725268 RepID=A0A7L6N410_9MOLU|nr:MMPL family transporter [Hujiaoplasma nucleasis]QLY39948.1 MMPL family transporter [Hujiaoplasma nucleasis]